MLKKLSIPILFNSSWTDHNQHDPGITILEALNYALTDLGFRTQLQIEDYLSEGLNEFKNYSPEQVLSNASFSVEDYRKYLIDLPGIRNAWVKALETRPQGRLDLQLDFTPFQFTAFQTFDLAANWLKGIPINIEINGVKLQFEFYIVFPDWHKLPSEWTESESITDINITSVVAANNEAKDVFDALFISAQVIFGDPSKMIELDLWARLPRGIPKVEDNDEGSSPISIFKQALQEQLTIAFFELHRSISKERAQRLLEIKKDILPLHRNLGEDWADISTIKVQQLAVHIPELELQAEADVEKVIARIYVLLEQFIDPDILPQSVNVLQEEGKTVAEIYEGPNLKNGVITSERLLGLERGEKLYTSDLVRIIMQQAEVIGVSGLNLSLFLNRIKAAEGVKNCLNLGNRPDFKARFSFDDSMVQVYKKGVRIIIDSKRLKECWLELKKSMLAVPEKEPDEILPSPITESLKIEDYYSIQHEFPAIYGLKKGEISSGASSLRKAQSRQLKAYLLFFEQLMANYFSQLANLSQLFSARTDIERTYFFQPLYDVPAIRDLFLDFISQLESSTAIDWETFKANANAYIKALNFGDEDQPGFRQRRYQFVSHLLARLGEDNSDYAKWVLARNSGQISADLLIDHLYFLQEAPKLSAERALAFNYAPIIEQQQENDSFSDWGSNVSGLEKRVAFLLGIPNYRRRSLSQIFQIAEYIEYFDEIDIELEGGETEKAARFRVWNAPFTEVVQNSNAYKVWLTSSKYYPISDVQNSNQLSAEIAEVIGYARQGRYYHVAQTQTLNSTICKYSIQLLDDRLAIDEPIAKKGGYLTNRGLVEEAIHQLISFFQGRSFEGMHLIEHILLRPQASEVEAEDIRLVSFLNEAPTIEPFIQDPYSFQISIFLPTWVGRFSDPEFRVLIEQYLRAEMPTHLYSWIYWIDLEPTSPGAMGEIEWLVPQLFIDFETNYAAWLKELNASVRNHEGSTVNTESNLLAAVRKSFITSFNALTASPFVSLTNRNAYQIYELGY